jgi:hypothetical protein
MSSVSNEQRIERMRAVWQESAPSAENVAMAYRRYVNRQHAVSPRRWLVDFAIAGAGAGLLLTVCAQLFLRDGDAKERARLEFQAVATAASVSPSAALAAAPGAGAAQPDPAPELRMERNGVVVGLLPGVQYEVLAGERVVVNLGPESQELVGPKVFQISLEVDRASGFRLILADDKDSLGLAPKGPPQGSKGAVRSSAVSAEGAQRSARVTRNADGENELAGSASAQSVEPNSDARDTAGSSGWQRAALAMRRGDLVTAQSELQSLVHAGGESRDAAELTLAQLWLSSGQVERARVVLGRLAREGSTAYVRRRAGELFHSLPTSAGP